MSKYLLHSLIMLLSLAATLVAQTTTNENERLLELLGLPPGKEIPPASSPKLVTGPKSLRVFLATDNEKRNRTYYARQIKQWNRYKNADLPAVELVPDLARADIILVRYKLSDKAKAAMTSTAFYYYVYDPVTRTQTPRLFTEKDYYRSVPVKGYILRREGQDLEILRESVFLETTKSGRGGRIGDQLWTSLIELVVLHQ